MANNEETQENLRDFGMQFPGGRRKTDNLGEKQYDARLNIKVPFKAGDWLAGNVKFGGMYRQKKRHRDYNEYKHWSFPSQKLISGQQSTPDGLSWEIPWVIMNDRNHVSMENMVGGHIDNFLDGRYNFGWYPDMDRANEMFDWFQNISQYYRAQGRNFVSPQQPGFERHFDI